jgi:hypothetical protein
MSASLISCWIHAWGFTLQSFPSRNHRQPRLLAIIDNPSNLLWCSSSSSPTPLPSCRCDALPSAPSPTDFPISRRPAGPVCSSPNAPRLQGFAPHQSLPLRAGGLDRPERMALLGFVVLQGALPPRHNRAFTRFPLTSFLASTSDRHNQSSATAISALAPQGFRYRRDWLGLSFDTAETMSPSKPADPLELPTPFDHPREFETSTSPGVASSSIGVHHCPLTCSL